MEFGGHLGVPGLSWKYSWVKKVFGWHVAKTAQRLSRKSRWYMEKRLEKLLISIDKPKTASLETGRRATPTVAGSAPFRGRGPGS